MNRRKTIKRRWHLGRLIGRPANRRLRRSRPDKAESPREAAAAAPAVRAVDLRAALRRGLASALRLALLSVKVALVVTLLGAALVGGYYTYHRVMTSTYFNVRNIEVRSTRRAPTDQIRRLVDPVKGKNILTVELEALRRAVVAHPWVRDARVERELPDTIVVHVAEHKAQALLMMGHLYLVNREGQVFKRADPDEALGMPVITGISRMRYLNHPEQAHELIARALATLDRYYEKVRPPLSEVHIDKRGEVTLHLRRGGLAVRMGDGITDERLTKLDAVWAALGPEVRRARVIFLDNVARKDRVTVRMGQHL